MPIVDTEPLFKDERSLRRAHVALSYLTHLYVHSATHDPSSPISIPPSLSIPLIKVSRELGVPPVISYAVFCLQKKKRYATPRPSTHTDRAHAAAHRREPPFVVPRRTH